MRIAFFSKQLPSDQPNGVSVQVDRYAGALVKGGHEVTVFTFSPPVEGAGYQTVTLVQRNAPKLLRKFAAAFAFRKVAAAGFDILHYHGDDYLCKGSFRRIRTFYGSALREALHAATFRRFCYQALFYLFERVSCVKRGTLAAISSETCRSLPHVKNIVPCCVPLDRFVPSADKTAHPSLLFLGDFRSRKRGLLLLEQFSSVILPNYPDAVLTVVGPVSCSGKGIRYLGRIPEKELIAEYQKSWVFCMPSSWEGFGVPVIEAFACGTAVVATRNRGVTSLVNDGVTGLLCEEHDLGKAICRLFADMALRTRLAASGLESVKKYGAAEVAARYESLYLTMING